MAVTMSLNDDDEWTMMLMAGMTFCAEGGLGRAMQ